MYANVQHINHVNFLSTCKNKINNVETVFSEQMPFVITKSDTIWPRKMETVSDNC